MRWEISKLPSLSPGDSVTEYALELRTLVAARFGLGRISPESAAILKGALILIEQQSGYVESNQNIQIEDFPLEPFPSLEFTGDILSVGWKAR